MRNEERPAEDRRGVLLSPQLFLVARLLTGRVSHALTITPPIQLCKDSSARR